MASLTDDEKARIRRHLGYPNVGMAASMQYGIPKPLSVAFLLETAMNQLLEQAVPIAREILGTLDELTARLGADAADLLEVKRLGTIEPNPDNPKDLQALRLYWIWELADTFGVPPYGFSRRMRGGQTVGNVRVRR